MSVQQPLSAATTDFGVGWPFAANSTPNNWILPQTATVASKSESFRSPIKIKLIPYNTESCIDSNINLSTDTLTSSISNNNKLQHFNKRSCKSENQQLHTLSSSRDNNNIGHINGYYNTFKEPSSLITKRQRQQQQSDVIENSHNNFSNSTSSNTLNRYRNRLDAYLPIVEHNHHQEQQQQPPTNRSFIAQSLSNINVTVNNNRNNHLNNTLLKNTASLSEQNFLCCDNTPQTLQAVLQQKSCSTITTIGNNASTSTLLLDESCVAQATTPTIRTASLALLREQCNGNGNGCNVVAGGNACATTTISGAASRESNNDNSPSSLSSGSSNSSARNSSATTTKLRAAKSESCLKSSGSGSNNSAGGSMSSASSSSSILLSDRDLDQVEMMYSSQGTKVFVCTCLANLYFNQVSAKTDSNGGKNGYQTQWELIVTGIPVVIMNCGESRSRTSRQLSIVLAERGTGFTLWKEVINNYSNYDEMERTFHTLNSSSEAGRLAGLSFDNANSASKFHQHVKGLLKETANSNNNSYNKQKSSSTNNFTNEYFFSGGLAAANKKQRRHSFVGGSKKMILRKAEISTPVCFKHITSVKPADLNPVILTGAGDSAVPKRAQSCVQILTIGDGVFKSIQ